MNQVFRSKYFWIIIVVLTSLIVLFPNIENGWLNWDDENYVLNNFLVHGISFNSLLDIFKTPEVMGNYHPLTLVSYAIEYELAGNNAKVFHTTNVFLHLINIILVFVLILKLSNKLQIAVFVSLLFGIHPMHLESVAWISARKDLLFSLFLLIGLLAYLKYINKKSVGLFLITLLLFCFSILSKGMAIIFPPILILIDILYKRRFTKSVFIEKVPFFLIALVFIFIGILAQQNGGAMSNIADVLKFKGIFIGTYGFTVYIFKLFVPIQLSAFHPYPFTHINEMPFYFYASIITIPLVILFLIKTYKKEALLFFGMLFYVVSIAPVIQILPFGKALFAERYTYIAYIGLFLVIALLINKLLIFFSIKHPLLKNILIQGIIFYLFIFAYQTYTRSAVWANSKSLWTDVIDKYPNDFFAYGNRANAEPNPLIAIEDYNKCIELNPTFFEAYNNRGLKNLDLKEYEKAIKDFHKTIQINAEYPKSYVNLGLCYTSLSQFKKALESFNQAIKLDSITALPYFNRGVLYNSMNLPEKANIDFNNAIVLNSSVHQFYEERSLTNLKLKKYPNALTDINRALVLNPNSEKAKKRKSLIISKSKAK